MPYNFCMSPDEVVRVLYRHLLGRDPDPGQGWTRLIVENNDPTIVLKGILESEEYKAKHPVPRSNCHLLASRAHALLNRRPRIIDVGAQTLGPGTHAYDALMRFCPVEIVGFDPLQDRLAERARAEGGDCVTLLPYAVGDGRRHTLHINNDDPTSSLYPLNVENNGNFLHLAHLRTVATVELDTKTLDELIPPHQTDFLKLDVQGGELLVLQGATRTLENTAVIHCEVEFGPIYRGQPLFSEVETFLLQRGFYFVDFCGMGRYTCINKDGETSPDQLLWADAVFFRESESTEIRAAQALIAAVVYSKSSLALRLLEA